MNAERKRLVLDSWQSVAGDHDRIASAFYERLFEIDPHARIGRAVRHYPPPHHHSHTRARSQSARAPTPSSYVR